MREISIILLHIIWMFRSNPTMCCQLTVSPRIPAQSDTQLSKAASKNSIIRMGDLEFNGK